MIQLKTTGRRHFYTLIKLQTPSNHLKNPPQTPYFLTPLISSNSSHYSFLSSIHGRPFSLSAHFANNSEEKSHKSTQSLSVFFKQAVGLSERTEDTVYEDENGDLKSKLRKLEEEVRNLNNKRHEKGGALKPQHYGKGKLVAKDVPAEQSLWALFADDNKKKREEKRLSEPIPPTDYGNEDPMVHKELSSDMQMFAHHLYTKGYFKTASFMVKDKFDPACFEVSYAREFLKYAAVTFGREHQEICKWLSASDLKKVALFGCPSLGQRSIYAAKHMRKFFQIEEHKVCQKCTIKESCKHANIVSKKPPNELHLGSVTRVLAMYALESVPRQLVVPKEVKDSVSQLLNELVSLSQTVP